MDKIFVNKMEFYGYHGVFPEETKLGQRFKVDLTVEADLAKAGKSDELEDSINYGELYEVCKGVVEGKPFKLVEAVAEEIASELLNKFSSIEKCTVKVYKPDPPIAGHYESVAIEIVRGR
ncbi:MULTISPECIES: dihydroneopterin aldolase [Peribacillus]|uniref:7,8-dihydroneopterin aldolase n=1 Tax=Peribacillus butanolivorans TaxID=421767 RepID=A0AAX0RQI4_9BACI|nr:dihydroneopterin aldolase [Peribacillus butanolivorans]KQU19708.1 dihydroneopterin aldolase [Bacillus sp. Leaf13]KRF63712.1 dihydroneopterin aldolase [Bacillus sp. Soil768D1]AXN39085.1 dihydroneopterin aldolase [Peribacillus butanolivorans]MED3690016.1 dihydroneopterin aldolase [Peribacillus butanolivorans]PEJ26852.1 dihydroneopterin aldolase [Peribacillus butanolivorans]